MAKANVDPAELKRFARDLGVFSTDLETLMNKMRARMLNLEKTWHDQEQIKFFEEFEQAMKILSRFIGSSQQHASTLMKKASHIEEYLQQR